MIQPTHGHFMAFMALKNQTIGFPNKSTPNEPSKLKKLPNFENLKFWPLFWPSKFFWAFYNFLLVLRGMSNIGFLKNLVYLMETNFGLFHSYFREKQRKLYSNFKSALYNWKLIRCDKQVAFSYYNY